MNASCYLNCEKGLGNIVNQYQMREKKTDKKNRIAETLSLKITVISGPLVMNCSPLVATRG